MHTHSVPAERRLWRFASSRQDKSFRLVEPNATSFEFASVSFFAS